MIAHAANVTNAPIATAMADIRKRFVAIVHTNIGQRSSLAATARPSAAAGARTESRYRHVREQDSADYGHPQGRRGIATRIPDLQDVERRADERQHARRHEQRDE